MDVVYTVSERLPSVHDDNKNGLRFPSKKSFALFSFFSINPVVAVHNLSDFFQRLGVLISAFPARIFSRRWENQYSQLCDQYPIFKGLFSNSGIFGHQDGSWVWSLLPFTTSKYQSLKVGYLTLPVKIGMTPQMKSSSASDKESSHSWGPLGVNVIRLPWVLAPAEGPNKT